MRITLLALKWQPGCGEIFEIVGLSWGGAVEKEMRVSCHGGGASGRGGGEQACR